MINEHSIQAVRAAYFDEQFCRPLYNSYCFSRLPATFFSYLTGDGKERALPLDVGGFDETADFVVFFFLDAFGWSVFDEYLPKVPLLQRYQKEGIISKITTQFPSTTTAQVTTLNTGLEVGQSGFYEWFLYEPSLEKIIIPLMFSFAGDKKADTLEKADVDPTALYPLTPLYEGWNKRGIHTFAMQPHDIAHSPYSKAIFRGAECVSTANISDALDKTVELYNTLPPGEKRYVIVYVGDIDSTGHHKGPHSPQHNAVVLQTLETLQKSFFERLQPKKEKKAYCIISADHGMIEISPQQTDYLNLALPEFATMIEKNKRGELLVPAGSCRDFFLHIRPERLIEAEQMVKKWLGEKAVVATTQSLIEQGFFGSLPPSPRFLERVGNLVILPRGSHAVWWYEKGRFEQRHYGMHGGLSRTEMEIPYLFLKL